MRVLVTGAAGSIGRPLVAGLAALGHEVRGFDRVAGPDDGPGHVVGALADAAALDRVVDGMQVVVHLAAIPHETDFATAVDSHVTGTWQVLEAMRRTGSGRIVLGSSNHAVGFHARAPLLGVAEQARPDTFYGVAKVAAEALCSLYVDRHGLSAVVLRIGSFAGRPLSRRHLSTWLSPADAVRLVHAAATADLAAVRGYAVVWGISANTRAWWDPGPGHAIGYHPVDDAEDFAAAMEARPAEEQDELDARVVGGPYTRVRPEGH